VIVRELDAHERFFSPCYTQFTYPTAAHHGLAASVQTSMFDEIVATFRCPMSGLVMVDPVTCGDGYSFDRLCVERWFAMGQTLNPVTSTPMSEDELVTNIRLKNSIEAVMMQLSVRERDDISKARTSVNLDIVLAELAATIACKHDVSSIRVQIETVGATDSLALEISDLPECGTLTTAAALSKLIAEKLVALDPALYKGLNQDPSRVRLRANEVELKYNQVINTEQSHALRATLDQHGWPDLVQSWPAELQHFFSEASQLRGFDASFEFGELARIVNNLIQKEVTRGKCGGAGECENVLEVLRETLAADATPRSMLKAILHEFG